MSKVDETSGNFIIQVVTLSLFGFKRFLNLNSHINGSLLVIDFLGKCIPEHLKMLICTLYSIGDFV
jgi:hypothetical protein